VSEQRKIVVAEDTGRFKELDREVKITVWLHENHSNTTKLSRVEAQDLQEQLTNYLWRDEQ
jgi:hypothetical protein